MGAWFALRGPAANCLLGPFVHWCHASQVLSFAKRIIMTYPDHRKDI